MGICASGMTPEQKAQMKESKKIDKKLVRDGRSDEKEVKLLLLGAGNSGKSTIAKQMQIIYMDGFKDDERMAYKPDIAANIIKGIQLLINNCKNYGKSWKADVNEDVQKLSALDPDEGELYVFEEDMVESLKRVWADRAIRRCAEHGADFNLQESAIFFIQDIDNLSKPGYVPTDIDLLRVRRRTTGIIEIKFSVGSMHFRLIDVGGQRNERRKWIHCFEGVTSIIFVVALSEYDQVLVEDGKTNRMEEALHLFEDIINNRWFHNTPIILFLNKDDLFREKIKKVSLKKECFSDYNGGPDYAKACKFIRTTFLRKNEHGSRDVYVHFTCATNTRNIETVFNVVRDVFVKRVIDNIGLGDGAF